MNISLRAADKRKQRKGGKSLSFGLNNRKKSGTNPSVNVFGDDGDTSDNDSDDGNQNISRRDIVNKQIAREQDARRRRAQIDLASVKDKSVYDFDGAYDSFRASTQPTRDEDQNNAERKSKYIGDLLKAAKVRERERDAIFERRNAREQAEEDAKDDYRGKDKFVTKSYKRKLQERKQWEAEQEKKEREEAANDVTKKSAGAAFAGFYGNLNRSVMMEPKKSNDESSSDSNASCDERVGKKIKNDDQLDDVESDPRQGFLGGFERASHTVPNVAEIDGNRKDLCDDEVAPLTKLTVREIREKKVMEARERYLKRKQALQLGVVGAE